MLIEWKGSRSRWKVKSLGINRVIERGEVLEVPDKIAKNWINSGFAVKAKSPDPETKDKKK